MSEEEQASIYAATSAEFETGETKPLDVQSTEAPAPPTQGSYDGPVEVDREKLQQDIAKFNEEISQPAPDERWGQEGEFDLPARLTKNQVMMILDGIGEEEVFFNTDAETERPRSYKMPREMFEEMGRPRVVTVTVRPGNQLT